MLFAAHNASVAHEPRKRSLLAPLPAASLPNPFSLAPFYVQPSLHDRISATVSSQRLFVAGKGSSTLQAMGAARASIAALEEVPSAFWVDSSSKILKNAPSDAWTTRIGAAARSHPTVESMLADVAALPDPQVAVFVLHALPNRDCHIAASSAGEICCRRTRPTEPGPSSNRAARCDYLDAKDDPQCDAGLDEYKKEIVLPFVRLLAQHAIIPTVVIIEPMAMTNLATNLEEPSCGSLPTQAAYEHGTAFAIEALHTHAPHAVLYLDAGHGGLLGWPPQTAKFVQHVMRLRDISAAQPAYAHVRAASDYTTNHTTIAIPHPSRVTHTVG